MHGHDILPDCPYQVDFTHPHRAFIYCGPLGMGPNGVVKSDYKFLPPTLEATRSSISCWKRIKKGECPMDKELKE